jgi:hypothetical protein
MCGGKIQSYVVGYRHTDGRNLTRYVMASSEAEAISVVTAEPTCAELQYVQLPSQLQPPKL